MGAYKITKKAVKPNFNYNKILYSNKVGIYSIVLYRMDIDSLLVIAEKDNLLLQSIQSDIADFDMDLIWIKNNRKLPTNLKIDFLSKSYELSSYLNEVWEK